MAEYVQVPGKVNIMVAFPGAYNTLFKIGESLDDIKVEITPITYEVPGDRLGGPQGDPIEEQFLGKVADLRLSMSRWDPAVIETIGTHGGILSASGTIPLSSVGSLMRRDRGLRILLYCQKDSTFHVNFPCCHWIGKKDHSVSSRFSVKNITLAAHRAPEGYWQAAASTILYDNDTTGYSTWLGAQTVL